MLECQVMQLMKIVLINGLEKLDASSIVGFKSVNNSDMILMPDPNSFKILPNDYDPGNRKNARIVL